MAKGNEEIEETAERTKARGQAPSQQEMKKYHEGDFQTTDPVTGEERGPTGGNWQDAESLEGNIIGEEISPEDAKAQQDEEIARSAGTEGEARPARKSAAKKAGRKKGR